MSQHKAKWYPPSPSQQWAWWQEWKTRNNRRPDSHCFTAVMPSQCSLVWALKCWREIWRKSRLFQCRYGKQIIQHSWVPIVIATGIRQNEDVQDAISGCVSVHTGWVLCFPDPIHQFLQYLAALMTRCFFLLGENIFSALGTGEPLTLWPLCRFFSCLGKTHSREAEKGSRPMRETQSYYPPRSRCYGFQFSHWHAHPGPSQNFQPFSSVQDKTISMFLSPNY